MSQTLSLFRLQQIDTQINRVQTQLQTIQAQLSDDAELHHAEINAQTCTSLYQSALEAVRKAETDAQIQCIKIEQTEASLYGGKGHSPKELLDLQNDLASLKRHLDTLEDVQLEAMVAVEESTAAHTAAQADLAAVQSHSAKQNQSLIEEQSLLRKELDKLFAERAAVSGPIPKEALGLYDQLRQQRRGIAVAAISDKSCSACGSGLSAAQMQSSRSSDQMALCPSCGRILYGN
jgi:predicted  nucleic acid-binding Zn-ribbon protein